VQEWATTFLPQGDALGAIARAGRRQRLAVEVYRRVASYYLIGYYGLIQPPDFLCRLAAGDQPAALGAWVTVRCRPREWPIRNNKLLVASLPVPYSRCSLGKRDTAFYINLRVARIGLQVV
jgi:hypothetical protein